MRLNHALFLSVLVSGTIGLANAISLEHRENVHSLRMLQKKGGLDDVFGWNEPAQDPSTEDSGQDAAATKSSDPNPKESIFDVFSTILPMETNSKKESTATTINPMSHTIIGTVPPLPTPTPKSSSTPKSSASPTSSSGSPTPSANAAVSSSGGDNGNSQWKIIGVAVIAFSAVAAILLLAVFFDQWWRFVKDMIGRRKAKDSVEEIVPDWEKASWEVRFGDDRHRYPSFSSMPDKSTAPGLVRGRSIRSELQWKERAAEAVQRSPLSSSNGHPPSPRSINNRGPRTPPNMYASQNHEAPYSNPFEPSRSPAPPDVYGGME